MFCAISIDIPKWTYYLFGIEIETQIRDYNDYVNDEVLHLCEQLCNCKFESIKKMLSDNSFYSTIIR